MPRKMTSQQVKSIGRIFGVTESDSKLQAAEKGLAAARLAGFSPRQIKSLEKIVDDARRRGIT